MQLTVTNVEDQVVAALERRAAEHGVSMEEEHRRILAKALAGKSGGMSFKDFLLTIPDVGEDWMFVAMIRATPRCHASRSRSRIDAFFGR